VARKTTIFDAIASGSPSRVKRFLTLHPEAVADRNELGQRPLMAALYAGEPAVVEALLERGAVPDHFEAAALGDLGLLGKQLRRSGRRATAYSKDGFTALHYAAFFGQPEAARLLLEHGADVEAESRNEKLPLARPLHSAVAGSRPLAVATVLLDAGADPSSAQSGGWTPLHSAALHGDIALVQLLLSRGALAWIEAYDMTRPLDFAIERRHAEIVRLLQKQPKRTVAVRAREASRSRRRSS
jgi:ankyrin repeat protein